jgi:hypothetical protein
MQHSSFKWVGIFMAVVMVSGYAMRATRPVRSSVRALAGEKAAPVKLPKADYGKSEYSERADAFAAELAKNPPIVVPEFSGPQGEHMDLVAYDIQRKKNAQEKILRELNEGETVDVSIEEQRVAVEMMSFEGVKSRWDK